MHKKSPNTANAEALESRTLRGADSVTNYTPRIQRLIAALRNGPKMREQLDRAIGASNSPHYVMELRRMGYEVLCERVKSTDRDGNPCSPGRYTMVSEPEVTHEFA